MTVTQFVGGPSCGIAGSSFDRRAIRKLGKPFADKSTIKAPQKRSFGLINRGRYSYDHVIKCSGSISSQYASDYIEIHPSGVEERFASSSGAELSNENSGSTVVPTTRQSPTQNVQMDLIMLSLPAIAGQAIEPLAQLMETAYIGRLGPLELASAGVSISIFNIISKVLNIPLLSVATSFVAEDLARNNRKVSNSDGSSPKATANSIDEPIGRTFLPSVSTALLMAGAIGVIEALAMYFGSGFFLSMMGISSPITFIL